MSKASNDQLSVLHGVVATVLKSALEQEYFDQQGNSVPPPAAFIANAIKFLKDNGIDAVAPPGSPLHAMRDLPVFDEYESPTTQVRQ